MGFIMYYPRVPLADCRSLPTLNTVMNAVGIEKIHGQAIEKLNQFLSDIGNDDSNSQSGEDILQQLLAALAAETGRQDLPSASLLAAAAPQSLPPSSHPPVTEEDILNQPFYLGSNTSY